VWQGVNVTIRSLFFKADAPASVILIRILVGWVFVSEGIGKFSLSRGTSGWPF
jgi:hypothetical protein